MIIASFARAIARFAGNLCLHFLPLFQEVVAIRKTCNWLLIKAIGGPVEEGVPGVMDTVAQSPEATF